MQHLLITGFEPFQGLGPNPSGEIARLLDGRTLCGYRVTGIVLPVIFGEAADLALRWVEKIQPAAVLSLGLAAEREVISVERFAVNWRQGCDARGVDCPGEPIIPGAPAAYVSTFPLREITEYVSTRAISVNDSNHAGVYICNEVFYRALHRGQQDDSRVPVGFIHLPPCESTRPGSAPPGPPGLALPVMARAVSLAVEALASCRGYNSGWTNPPECDTIKSNQRSRGKARPDAK